MNSLFLSLLQECHISMDLEILYTLIIPDNPRQIIETKEPLVEVIESDKTVSITSELIGVLKESIELEITQNTVVIKVNNGKENFYKEVELPCNVDVDSAITRFQNGVLDVELKKVN